MKKLIYIASSWRNKLQPEVVARIREAGYEVYDFRHPEPGSEGFSWTQADPAWVDGTKVNVAGWHMLTMQRIARQGFKLDYDAMKASDACVLVLPAGRSAHLEAGYFRGFDKRLIVLMPEAQEPDLMYLMANAVVGTVDEVIGCLDSYYGFRRSER